MTALIETLHQASANPYAWAVVCLIALVAAISVYKWRTCPYLCHTADISQEQSQAQVDRPFVAGPRFVIVMLAGIAAMVVGLTLVSRQVYPALALLMIAVGVFAVQTEPALLQIRESVKRLIAAQVQGLDQVAAAEERLRYAHLWLVTANITLLLAVILALLAF